MAVVYEGRDSFNASGAGCKGKANLVSLAFADPLLSASEGYIAHQSITDC